MTSDLLDRLGGETALKAAVDEFCVRLLDDSNLATFFEEASMPALKRHQLEFMKIAFSGVPDDLNVVDLLTKKQSRLFAEKNLNETHFDLVAGHFARALEHLKVPESLVEEASSVVLSLRPVFESGSKKFDVEEKEFGDSKSETLLQRLGGASAVRAADSLKSLSVPEHLINEAVDIISPLRAAFEEGALEAKSV
ncbi:predicted protein [Phaeodactylum tricornutum CCAP 1055/1]|jgi:hemoglobin|uniref:Uncharacterized protein n=1 Tax=Phaeodactylum tricornutum (strain CCAP 1055/1) TaxID=556484 RepID=B7G4I8_PHATC|nr:predicted protein [Phaeodactylum tricornutum CCAP 1055/1]EEC46463.1 predicted protein [Phaeodactylum tricornutum CCAP 1055/1]|eukprot:XP_002181923.1 predicted protein [Phaeodactylum tricornutum CCAP 1055/1]